MSTRKAKDVRRPTGAVNAVPDGQNMLVDERRQHVLDILERDGRVLVSELSALLRISPITVRKDLDDLESRGLIKRTHGGALLPRKSGMLDRPLKENDEHETREKQLIAEAAVSLVREGQCVLLDSGSTITSVARELRRFSHLTIVTNALNIAADLSDTNFDIILVGGHLRKSALSLVGPLAEDVLREIHADILFLGVDGFDVDAGITTPSIQEARVNRVMVNVSQRVVAVCDSSKFKRRSLALIIPPSAVHEVITDSLIEPATRTALESAGVKVTTV